MVAPKMDFNSVSQKARLEFIRTVEKNGQVLAVIADRQVLGDDGITSFKQALNAGQAPRVRAGVHVLTAAQLEERLPALSANKDTISSAASFRRALQSISVKQVAARPAPKAASFAMG